MEGITKCRETPNPEAVARNLFEEKQVPDLSFLDQHFSPKPLAEQIFSHENIPSSEPQPKQPQQPEQPEQHEQQPKPQPEQDQPQPEPQPEPKRNSPP
ncbi:hypothetical protein A2U01_0058242, partial [Trifolium medium]|nr:hypothetical protein [Trifolium medium]